jgi:hypothetical protein
MATKKNPASAPASLDLKLAYEALRAKNVPYKKLWDYYDGDHPLMYTASRLEEIFKDLDAVFTQNWCAVVIDSVNDRINLKGITFADTAAQTAWDALWGEHELAAESDDAHLAAQVVGEAFIIAWKNEKKNAEGEGAGEAEEELQVFYNDPRLCHVEYDPENPHRKAWAAKWWDDALGYRRLTLYYADHLEYYRSNVKAQTLTSVNAFKTLMDENGEDASRADNPFGEIPVFHFRPQRRKVISDLKNAIPIQNGVNKLLVDMMVAAEFGAFKQRWVITNANIPGKLKNAPKMIWEIPAGDGQGQQTQVGEFSATDLDNYIKAVDNLAGSLSSITRTPKHYFSNQGGDPSGEALITMESPLVKKAQERIDRFAPVWRSLASFIMKLNGSEVDESAITPVFDDPRTTQPVTQANVRKTSKDTGIPLRTLLRREGWTKQELADMDKDANEERQAQQTTLAAALLEAKRRAAQGQATDTTGGQGDQQA